MRILIHSINFSPELTGIGKYTGEMAEWLAAHGHEVRVVTAPPYYPQWRVAEGCVNGWQKERICRSGFNPTCRDESRPTENIVTVYRCPLWVPAKPSGLKRLVHLASFALSSFPVMLGQIFWRPDVVLVVEPPLFCAPQAWLVARLSGAKAWLHIQDFEVDAAFDLGILQSRRLRKWVLRAEQWLMRRFDRVSTISDKMLDKLVSKGVPPEKLVLFQNWMDIEGLRTEDSGLSGYRAELGIAADAVVALYSGNMGGKQGLEILADVASICRSGDVGESGFNLTRNSRVETRPTETCPEQTRRNESRSMVEIVFVFCGNGAGRADLVKLCDGLPNVRFMDLQPLERLGELLAMADIHLLPQRAEAADLVMPSKLTGMLASGRPVVATAYPGTQLAKVVEMCGLITTPGDADELANAVQQLSEDMAIRVEMGKRAREYALENLGRDEILGKFAKSLEACVKDSGPSNSVVGRSP